jgi:uncharacterized protein YbjQ (UPF0145 family)
VLQSLGSALQNVELPNYTQALYMARELAMERMQFEAQQVEATGVLGVQIVEKNHVWGHHAIEFFAIGTAVTRFATERPTLRPRLVLGLE